jgi:hypothetical protein
LLPTAMAEISCSSVAQDLVMSLATRRTPEQIEQAPVSQLVIVRVETQAVIQLSSRTPGMGSLDD